MCGITGIIGALNVPPPVELGRLTAHRGPNNLGFAQFKDATLIHNRLSIIDLSSEANQPMTSGDDRYVIIYNGEIYNFLTLRTELENLSCHFNTRSDTEVILLGYKKWGTSLLDKLDGMFAFAIWDKLTKKLFCARDHIGQKPLFYSHIGNALAFTSELKVIEALGYNKELCHDAIAEYVTYNYIPAPKTIYRDVFKLEPGHFIEYDLNTNELNLKKWWSVPKNNYLDIDYHHATKLVREKVSEAIRSQLIADVPVGAFLSGGIDSSIIAAEMAQSMENAKVYTIKYADNDEYDESKYAEIIAKKFGLDQHIITPDFDNTSILETVDLILSHMDEPYGNPTVAMTNQLCKGAREEVAVALVGDGADELFGGYPRYRALSLVSMTKPFVKIFQNPLFALLNQFPETPSGSHKMRRLKKFVSAQNKSMGSMFQDWTSILPIDKFYSCASDLSKDYLSEARGQYLSDLYNQADSDNISSACYTDQQSFLPYNLLDGSDRLAMAASFELRIPFVNRSLIELSSQLKPEWKIKGKKTKRILKDAYNDILPKEILNRPKRGFNPPVWHWLQNNKQKIHELLSPSSQISKLFKTGYTSQLLNDFYSKKEDSSSHIWSLIVLERWLSVRKLQIK